MKWFELTFTISLPAGAFAAFFTTAYNKKDETEFQISGIKGRPLPEVPNSLSGPTTNGNGRIESEYDEIPAHIRRNDPGLAPYGEFVKLRTETVSEDSVPSSPTRNASQSSFKEERSRSSTQGSRDSACDDGSFNVLHDSTGEFRFVLFLLLGLFHEDSKIYLWLIIYWFYNFIWLWMVGFN